MAVKKAAKDEKDIDEQAPESADERAARKAKAQAQGPIAKSRKAIVKPKVGDLYPWAANRGKAERAHTHVTNKGRTDENPSGDRALADIDAGTPAFQQAVMDHYTLHGGLVIGQEKATVVGRKSLANFHANTDEEKPNGSTTTDMVGEFAEAEGAEDGKDSDED